MGSGAINELSLGEAQHLCCVCDKMLIMAKKKQQELVIFKGKNGQVKLRGDFHNETIWATQAEIVSLFGVDQSVVSRHINSVFKDKEVDKNSNMHRMHIANSDKPVSLYSLDVMLSVGYRTNSKVAIEFRRWATQTLSQHITRGFTINRSQLANNYDAFMEAVDKTRSLLPAESSSA